MIALGYARQSQSRDEDESLSLAFQDRRIRDYAERNGYDVEAVYSDLDVPGNVESRIGLNDLIARCDAGGVDAVVIYNVSRLARDTMLFLRICKELDRRRIQLLSTSESTEDRTVVSILAAFAERERIQLSNTIAYSVREAARRGKMVLPPPFGYTRIDGSVTIDDYAAPIVRRIFGDYASGRTTSEIMHALHADGIRSPEGVEHWRTSTITRMLGNRAYVGEIAIAESRDPAGRIRPALITEGTHEPIISRDLWERCARRRQSAVSVRRHTKYPTPWIAGHCLCASCGSRLYLEVLRSKPERVQPYWILRCASSRMEMRNSVAHPCTGQKVASYRPFDAILRHTLAETLDRVITPEQAIARAREQQGTQRVDRGAQLRDLVEDGTKRLARLWDAYENGAIELAEYRKRKTGLTDQIEAARAELDTLPPEFDSATFEVAYAELTQASDAITAASDDALRVLVTTLGATAVIDVRARDASWRFAGTSGFFVP